MQLKKQKLFLWCDEPKSKKKKEADDEPLSRGSSKKKKDDEDEDEDEEPKKGKKESGSATKCPHGYKFGVDTNKKQECEDCDMKVWNACSDMKEKNSKEKD